MPDDTFYISKHEDAKLRALALEAIESYNTFGNPEHYILNALRQGYKLGATGVARGELTHSQVLDGVGLKPGSPIPLSKAAAVTVGTWVEWSSQAGGVWTTKEGRVVEIVPMERYPSPERIKNCGLWRDHTSYVIEVPGKRGCKSKFYWPRVGSLRIAVAPEGV